MSGIEQFFRSLQEKGIEVELDGDGGLDVRAPKGVLAEERELLKALKERKQDIVDHLRRKLEAGDGQIPRAPQQVSYPLSSPEMGIWIGQKMWNDPSVYNFNSVTGLKRSLDMKLFEQAIMSAIDRHEILRTVFREDAEGNVRQWIMPLQALYFRLGYMDLRRRADRYDELWQFIHGSADRPFDLQTPPLFRVSLYRMEEDQFYVHYTLHHIISDGWSLNILIRDVFEFYEALLAGRPAELDRLRINYKDYAVWQQEQLANGGLEPHRAYWMRQLQGERQSLNMVPDNLRPRVQTAGSFILNTMFDAGLTSRLREFSTLHKGSLFMGLVACVRVLLYRYTGQNDLILGMPIAGRDLPELQDQIGLYVNTLALRTPIEEGDSFRRLFLRVRSTVIEAFEHQFYPFDRLIEDIGLKRDASRNALFDVMIGLQNFNENVHSSPGDKHEEEGIVDRGPSRIKYDLLFDFQEMGSRLDMNLEYNTAIYDKAAILRMVNHFKKLLAGCLERPDLPLGKIGYLADQERHQLLQSFNDTAIAYPAGLSISDLWSRWAAKRGDADAVVYEGVILSCRELEERANQLAHYLLQSGIGRGSVVPVCLDRSVELVIAMLAIVKAGAAYIPIDPSYPEERIAYILSDAGAGLLVTHSYYSDIAVQKDCHPYYIDKDRAMTARMPVHSPGSIAGPQDLAYIIYTSGSTGRPKGVMIEHTSVVNLINWHIGRYGVEEESHSTAMAGVGFDAFALETWSALLSGSVLYIVSDSIKLQTDELLNFYVLHGITHAFVPPALVPDLVNALQPEGLSLKYVLIGGDRLPSLDTSELSYTLVNQYGPTESTVMVTDYLLPKERARKRLPPIGKPTANVRLYILDEYLSPVPIGISGEIYIAGVQLARGYYHNEELTGERFPADPFYPGSRMYRTGDGGRWLPDGNIEYMGRTDEQVKIRGYRVETGESENALQQLEEITSAIVLPCRDVNDVQVLVGYYTGREEIAARSVRQRLLEKLPEYMVPAYLMQVDNFPLTPNGKIDRNALPDPFFADAGDDVPYIPPGNELEQVLSEVYADVLRQDRVGIRSSFFDLGGDSIKAILLVNRLKQRGYALKVGDVLHHPVIEDLVGYVGSISRTIAQHAVEGEVNLLPVQRRLFETGSRFLHHYNQSVLLRSRDRVDIVVLGQVLDRLVLHHDALRMVYRQDQGEWRQYNQGPAVRAYSLDVYMPEEKEAEKAEMARRCDELQESFDLETGPLVKVCLFRMSDGDQLLIIIHHLVVDGVSWRIILEDLSTLYEQAMNNVLFQLPLKSDSLQEWARRLPEYSHSEAMSEQLPYWRTIAGRSSDRIPPDHPDGVALLGDVSSVTFTLDKEATSLLQTGVNKVFGTEINDILLAALAVSLKDTFSISSILLQLEGHGREDLGLPVNIDRTVGWFTTVYPFLLDLTGSDELTDHLINVKDALRSVPAKGIGYGLLRYLRVNGDAELGGAVAPQVTFNYLGDFGSGVSASSGEELFTYSEDYQGKDLSDQHETDTPLTVTGILVSGLLQIRISYGQSQFSENTITRLAKKYEKNLLDLLSVLHAERRSYLTPGDLSYKGLSAKEWKAILRGGDVEDVYEMSPLQEGMYYHWLTDRHSTVYVEQSSFRVKGNLKTDLLARSYDYLVERHSILRTAFSHEYGAGNLQIVRRQVKSGFRSRRKQEGEETALFCEACRQADRKEGFNLGEGSQMRLTVLDLGDSEFELIWCHHHVLMDGWCGAVLINEFHTIYENFLRGEEPRLDKPYPYVHYIRWLSKRDAAAGQHYWEAYLQGFNRLTPVPFRRRWQDERYDMRVSSRQLEPGLAGSVREICRRLEVTGNTFMQAAWGYLLSMFNDTGDVVFGAVVSGRPAGELDGVERMIGLFINTIPVRVRYEAGQSIKQLLQEVQVQAILSLAHHYNRLSDVQSQSSFGRDLFDHVLIYENYPVEIRPAGDTESGEGLGSLQILDAVVVDQTNYDFNVMIIPSGPSVHLVFRYNGSLYDEASVLAIQSYYVRMIEEFSEDVDRPLSDLGVIGEKEWEELLRESGPVSRRQSYLVEGYTVWPEEIVTALRQVPGVHEAILTVEPEADGRETLVVYYTGDGEVAAVSLKAPLHGVLPGRVMPDHFIYMDKLPRAAGGDIDFTLLPKPVKDGLQPKVVMMPRNDAEEKIAALWREVLKKEIIGVEDDFFRLGGNSLRILQVLNQYHRVFDVRLSPDELFGQPTISGHAALIGNYEKEGYRPIPQTPVREAYAVSDGQRRLWVLSQLESGSRAYHIAGHIVLDGDYDPNLFEKAIHAVIERHEILRTVFRLDADGQLKQVVKSFDPADFRLKVREMDGASPEAVGAYLVLASRHLFDLGKGPLLKTGFIRTGSKKYLFHYNIHHIISDGESMGVLLKEVLHYHEAYSKGEQPLLPSLRIQYKDYAAWQQDQLAHHLSSHRDYWLAQLGGELPLLDLPIAGTRPVLLSNKGYIVAIGLEEELTDRLQSLCFANNSTLFMGLLSALHILLYRYTGQSDLITGNTVAGRDHADLEEQIGFYVNMLAIRTHVREEDSFEDFLRQVRGVTLEAYLHQSYPYDRLVEELPIKRDMSRQPIFDVVINLKDAQSIVATGLVETGDRLARNEVVEIGDSISKFDLLFDFTSSSEGLDLHIEFNGDVYDKETIKRMARHYLNLLRSITEDPYAVVGAIDYLSAEERADILYRFNDTDAVYSPGRDIVSIFRQRTAEYPDRIAVLYEEQMLTYRELDEWSTRLANALYREGVERDQPVLLCAERSVETIAGMLAILKAGGAYVPVDPSYPVERVRFMLADTQAALIVGSSPVLLSSGLLEGVDVKPIYTDRPENYGATGMDVPAYPVCVPDQLAYVIYTSGSTGKPKGVMMEHKAVINLVDAMDSLFPGKALRVAMVASFSFDASVGQIFGALLPGNTLCIVPDEVKRSGHLLWEYYFRHRIDVSEGTPAHVFLLSQSVPPIAHPVPYLFIGGEALPTALVKNFYTNIRPSGRYPVIVNSYGPTETCVNCNMFTASPEVPWRGTIVPIGKPLANLQVYILDDALQLQPIGIPGELYIGGIQLSRGYWNNQALTDERFVPHPFRTGERIYRSGDKARWLPGGIIEYIGRSDEQVKIRGYRIETGEVEHALLQVGGIRSAVVLRVEEPDGRAALAAYLISDGVQPIGRIREGLSRILPAYMIPSYFVLVESLPLNSSGKVDKKVLAKYPFSESETGVSYAEAANEREAALVAVFEDVLLRKKVSVKESFFDLGGDSIKAILLINRLKQRGYTVKVADVLEDPVIERLAVHLHKVSEAIPQEPVTGEVELTPIQRQFLEGNYLHKHHYNQSVLLSSVVPIDVTALEECLELLFLHHDALRMKFYREAGQWRQYNAGPSEKAASVETYDLRLEKEPMTEMARLCDRLQQSIDLEKGPLLRIGLFRLPDGDRLLLVAHHLVMDGVSWRILLEDISSLYEQQQRAEPLSLPAKTDSLQQWGSKLRQYAQSEVLAGQLRYWQAMDQARKVRLKPDVVGQPALYGDTIAVEIELEPELTAILNASHKKTNAGMQELLLTALTGSVRDTFGLFEVMVLLEGHGREEVASTINVSRTIGWFTSLYPFLLTGAGGGDILGTLEKVRKDIGLIPQKGIGFGVLKYFGDNKTAQWSKESPADITFNYLGDFGTGAVSQKGPELFGFSEGYQGKELSEDYPMETLLTVTGLQVNGRLRVNIRYSRLQFYTATMDQLSASYRQQLESLAGRLAVADSDRAVFPLSKNQLWFFRGLQAVKAHGALEFHLAGFQKERFTRIYRQWLDANEILRIRPFVENELLFQELLPVERPDEQVHFIWNESLDPDDPVVKGMEKKARETELDVFKGEIVRCVVIHNDSNAIVYMLIHHIATDGFSNQLLKDRFIHLYQGGQDHPEPGSSYFTFVDAQNAFLRSKEGEAKRSYWLGQLDAILLPEKAASPVDAASGTRVLVSNRQVICAEHYETVLEYCRREHILLSSFILSLFYVYLSESVQKDAVIVNVVVDGRDGAVPGFDVARAIGQFVNTIPVVLHCGEATRHAKITSYVQQQYLEGRLRQEIPFTSLSGHYMEQHGIDLYQWIDASVNYFDNTGMRVEQEDMSEYSLVKVRDGQRERLTVVATAFSNGVVLHWDVYMDGWGPGTDVTGELAAIAAAIVQPLQKAIEKTEA